LTGQRNLVLGVRCTSSIAPIFVKNYCTNLYLYGIYKDKVKIGNNDGCISENEESCGGDL